MLGSGLVASFSPSFLGVWPVTTSGLDLVCDFLDTQATLPVTSLFPPSLHDHESQQANRQLPKPQLQNNSLQLLFRTVFDLDLTLSPELFIR